MRSILTQYLQIETMRDRSLEGKNRYCGRENYGTMIKRYDPIGFNVGYREWVEQPE